MPDAVQIRGLRELRRDLKVIDSGLPRELAGAMQEAAQPVARKAGSLATKGKTGRYARSIAARRQQRQVAIGSGLPYANVRHWGGTTGRGHRPGVAGSGSVHVKGDFAIVKAAEQDAETFLDTLGDQVEQFFARHGFR